VATAAATTKAGVFRMLVVVVAQTSTMVRAGGRIEKLAAGRSCCPSHLLAELWSWRMMSDFVSQRTTTRTMNPKCRKNHRPARLVLDDDEPPRRVIPTIHCCDHEEKAGVAFLLPKHNYHFGHQHHHYCRPHRWTTGGSIAGRGRRRFRVPAPPKCFGPMQNRDDHGGDAHLYWMIRRPGLPLVVDALMLYQTLFVFFE
jgi:hypothetical protein